MKNNKDNVYYLCAPEAILIDTMLCECGNNTFFITEQKKAVCSECRYFVVTADLDE